MGGLTNLSDALSVSPNITVNKNAGELSRKASEGSEKVKPQTLKWFQEEWPCKNVLAVI